MARVQAILAHTGKSLYSVVTAQQDSSNQDTFERLVRALIYTIPAKVQILGTGYEMHVPNAVGVGTFLASVCGYPGYLHRLRDALETATPATVGMARFRYYNACLRARVRSVPYLDIASMLGGPDAVAEFYQLLALPAEIPTPVMSTLTVDTDMPAGLEVRVDTVSGFCGFEVDGRLLGMQIQYSADGSASVPCKRVPWAASRGPQMKFPDGPPQEWWLWPAFTNVVNEAARFYTQVKTLQEKYPALPTGPVEDLAGFMQHPRVTACLSQNQ